VAEEGTGLGLATVRGIVEGARGRIAVESAPGAGTTFRAWFPALPEARSSAA
jgi:two-component system cell cycle sensor histidine kinase/response regulator CckA